MSMGPGKEFEDDSALGMVIQSLNRFPGMGWDMLRTGLRNRVGGVRNVSVRVLGEWEMEAWPPDAMEELRHAAAREPDAEIRQRIEDLMDRRSGDSDTL